MITIRLALLTWLSLGSTAAAAGTSFTVAIAMNKAGTADRCAAEKVSLESPLDKLAVKIDVKQRHTLHLAVERVGSVETIRAGATEVRFPDAAYANHKLLVMNGIKKVCELLLAPAIAVGPATVPTPPPALTAPPVEVDLATLEQGARAFLAEKRITDHEVMKESHFGRTLRVYHLPTGAPAFPLPRHVNEKDDVEIWTVLPGGAAITVEVSACDKVPVVRVAGTYKLTKDAVGVLQSGEAPAFRLDAYAKRLSCAGTLTYKLDVKYNGVTAQTSTSIPFEPVYRFEWGVGFMFDFGRPHKLSLGDRPTASGTASEKFVIESDDYAGAKPVITLGVNVCGTNPAAMTWCDRLLNPTLLVDPTHLTSGFGVGLTFRPFHGFGVLAGMTVFKSTVLADDAKIEAGETWGIAGELPTKDVFNADSLGFVLAAVISTDVFTALAKSE